MRTNDIDQGRVRRSALMTDVSYAEFVASVRAAFRSLAAWYDRHHTPLARKKIRRAIRRLNH